MRRYQKKQLNDKKIILFGCGQSAEKFCEQYGEKLQIEQVWSNNPKEKKFCVNDNEYAVTRPMYTDISEKYIIICSNAFDEISEQLMLYGYQPFEEFGSMEWVLYLLGEKKCILFYGFCHLRAIKDYLLHAEQLTEKYTMLFVANYLRLTAVRQQELVIYAQNCDVFISGETFSQRYKRKNDALRTILKKDCVELKVPLIYWGGYFPQKKRYINDMNRYAVKCEGWNYTPFSYADEWLNECIDRGMMVDDVWELLQRGIIADKEFVLKYLETEWTRCRFAESKSDFVITDFLEKNYRKERLFRNEAHMENIVIREYAVQILERLVGSVELPVLSSPLLMCSQHLIFSEVAELLELKWNVKEEQLDLYTYDGWKKVSAYQYLKYYMETGKKIKQLKERHMLP